MVTYGRWKCLDPDHDQEYDPEHEHDPDHDLHRVFRVRVHHEYLPMAYSVWVHIDDWNVRCDSYVLRVPVHCVLPCVRGDDVYALSVPLSVAQHVEPLCVVVAVPSVETHDIPQFFFVNIPPIF